MKAVRLHKLNSLDSIKYEDVLVPAIRNNEVLVKVGAAGVNPADYQSVFNSFLTNELPRVLGYEFSGTIKKVGTRINKYKVGDKVFGMIFPDQAGTYKEYAAVPCNRTAIIPKGLAPVNAAALPVVGLTAWQALIDAARIKKGNTVFIHGAAGGVGHIAVQIAKWKGAYVIGTGSARNRRFILGLGADEFVDYKKVKYERHYKDVDAVLDMYGDEAVERSLGMLRKNGIIVTLKRGSIKETVKGKGVRGQYVLAKPNPKQLLKLGQLAAAGHIKPYVEKTYQLKNTKKALEYISKGHAVGKTVISVIK